jgi:hypothetical protein
LRTGITITRTVFSSDFAEKKYRKSIQFFRRLFGIKYIKPTDMKIIEKNLKKVLTKGENSYIIALALLR